MAGRNPQFFLIGAMKAGSTTLYDYLCRHPDVFMCTPKEPQFFSRDHAYARGIDWYRSLFAGASPDQLCGEASTCYSRWPHFGPVPARIKQAVPGARFLYIMRHPVDRAFSHYRHLMEERVTEGEPVVSFEQAIESIPEIVDTSLYLMQIRAFLEQFPRDRFLFLTLDDLDHEPGRCLEQVQRFLGLPVLDLTQGGALASNPAGSMVAQWRSTQLVDRMRHLPVFSRLIDLLPQSARRRIRAGLTSPRISALLARRTLRRSDASISSLSPTTRNRLLARFAQPDRELAEFLGCELPNWTR